MTKSNPWSHFTVLLEGRKSGHRWETVVFASNEFHALTVAEARNPTAVALKAEPEGANGDDKE
jgi:hypothetical protein